MTKRGDATPSSPVARLGVILFAGLFALTFGGGGLYVGVVPLLKTFSQTWQVRHWQPVSARVSGVQFESSRGSKGGNTYRVVANYDYEFNGQTWHGRRIGLDDSGMSDNLGEWHSQWHSRLQQARASGDPITAWVDPGHPEHAVLERDIRWPLVAFRLPFAVLFTAVGAVAAWVVLAAAWGRPIKAPWSRAAQGSPGALSNVTLRPKGSVVVGLWIGTLAWAVFTLPFMVSVWSQSGAMEFKHLLTLALFGGGSGLLLLLSVRATTRHRGLGRSRLSTSPHPPRVGEAAHMQIQLSDAGGSTLGSAPWLSLRLGMHMQDRSGSSPVTRMPWHQTQRATAQALPDGTHQLAAHFELPPNGFPSEAVRRGERVFWQLDVMDDHDKVRMSFEIPVSAGLMPAEQRGPAFIASPLDLDRGAKHTLSAPADTDALPALPRCVSLQEDAHGWNLSFNRRAVRGMGLVALLVAISIPAYLAWLEEHHGFASAHNMQWRMCGALALALALHWITHRWTIRVNDAGLWVDRSSWLWPRRTHAPASQVRTLHHKLSFINGSSAGNSTEYHCLWWTTPQHTEHRLSPALAQADTARAIGLHVLQALAHRDGRFEAEAAGGSMGLNTAAWVCPAAWLAWGAVVYASLLNFTR